tara:strand:- start:578 stop:790 length:213 start_codon:yes stop_codon:yes gene_type:complete
MKTFQQFMETLPHSGVVTPKQMMIGSEGSIRNTKLQNLNFKDRYPNFPNIFLDKRGMVKKKTINRNNRVA